MTATDLDLAKAAQCCWKGFDHESKEGSRESVAKNQTEAAYHLAQAPHATMQYSVAIENKSGQYVCCAGMWWTPANKLAYMEPLCTIPEYRRRGLASAALSEMYRKMNPLGATHMTGGANNLYQVLGFKPMITFTYWTRK